MTSKLQQMQAQYQKRQMQEREEKLVKLYTDQQQRAFDRVGSRGSAGSSGSLPMSTGKVRQMFDERRQKAGIDRSYPLEPLKALNNGSKTRTSSLDSRKPAPLKTMRTTTVTNKAFNNSANKPGSKPSLNNNNNNYEDIVDNYTDNLTTENNLVKLMNNNNLNGSLDDPEEMPRIGFDDYDILRGKLANIGGKLPSEKLATTQKTHEDEPPKVSTKKTKTPLGPAASSTRRPKTLAPSTTTTVKSTPVALRTTNSSAPSKESSPLASPAKKPTTMKAPSQPASAATMGEAVRAPAAIRNTTKPVARPFSSNVQRDDLVACRYCQRRFANDRIQAHEDICSRTGKKKRRVYDATKHRLGGTELEPYVKKPTRSQKSKTPVSSAATKTGWRQKHEEFIAAIRAAKMAQAHIAKGGNIRDLPPPPPSSNPDYVQCPHCGRRFNEQAAARHIPKCANYQYNKPKPSANSKK